MNWLPSLLLVLASSPSLLAQWEVEQSHTSSSLRGIVSVGGGVAWASGTDGTIIRSEDGGYLWQGCAVPPDAAKLDFRGIQAWDENTAIVMSSGTGDLSRLYRTTDGCRSWTLLLKNKDKDGFWDALRFSDRQHGTLLGDPVHGHFVLLTTTDGGATWTPVPQVSAPAVTDQSVFAASNSSLLMSSPSSRIFCTGGPGGAAVVTQGVGPYEGKTRPGEIAFGTTNSIEELVNFDKSAASGCFSLAETADGKGTIVAVGGDYMHPDRGENTAWTTAAAAGSEENKGHPLFLFAPATTKPAGYRSAVAYDTALKAWIAVGPGGTDVSTDNGQNWRPLKPGKLDAADADKQWNALSLPFVVGPHGRVGKLRGSALGAP